MEINFQVGIDAPTNNQQFETGFMLVKGWAFDSLGKDLKIEISVDDTFITLAHHGLPRYDLFRKYQTEESYESGFISRIPIGNLALGSHRLKVFVKEFSVEPFEEVSFVKLKKKKSLHRVPLLEAGQIGEFRKTGRRYLEHCKTLANLKPDGKILEVGCGMGRFAHAFSKYLNENGSYDAIDSMSHAIEYCKEHISKRYQNFNFQWVDVYNEEYNHKGKFSASNFNFPFQDNTFDLVFLHSVFTHLLQDDMKNYLKEISRVLKSKGKCLITFVLYSEERLKFMESNNIEFQFYYKGENYLLKDINKPENSIAYDENFIRSLFEDNDLEIEEPIHFTEFTPKGIRKRQDFIIAKKLN